MSHQKQIQQITVREAINQPSLRIERDYLRNYKDRIDTLLVPDFWRSLSELKNKSVIENDQLTAKAIWCMETIGRIQDHFVSVFIHIRENEFKEAWYQLDRCDTEIRFVDSHFMEEDAEYGIEFARVQTKHFQDLYPYNMGISPAMLYEEMLCSICKTRITLRSGCDHKVGEIYNGEMCSRTITKVRLLHISIVDDPVQKYSVIFPNGNDDPKLKPINELVTKLSSPWHPWLYRKEVRKEYHPAFAGVSRNDRCPCGSSLKFKRCCLNKDEVYPHYFVSILS